MFPERETLYTEKGHMQFEMIPFQQMNFELLMDLSTIS